MDLRIYLYFISIWIIMGESGSLIDSSPNYIAQARCRAMCLQQYPSISNLHHEDEKCVSPNCETCWNSCHWLYDRSAQVEWRYVCSDKNLCMKPCQKACKFKNNPPAGPASKGWQLHVLVKQSNLEKTVLEWNITSNVGSLSNGSRADVIYVLLARDRSEQDNSKWNVIKQTSSSYSEIQTDTLFPETEIWIRAVGLNGTIAGRKLPIDTMYDEPKSLVLPSDLNLQIETKSVNGKVKAFVTWQNLQVDDNVTINYDLAWFRKDCNVYADSPYCTLPHDVFYQTVTVYGKHKKTKELSHLTFNTEFEIQLEAQHGSKKWLSKQTFYTPFCYRVSSLFERCLQEDKTIGVPNTTASPVEELWKLNISDAIENDNDTVTVTISWLPFLNQSSGLLYNVTWRDHISGAIHSLSFDSKTTSIPLVLRPDSSYEVKVVATFQEPSGHWMYLGEKLLDVFTYKPATDSQAVQVPSTRQQVRPTVDEFEAVIVGTVCIVAGIVIAIIAFFVYKKRKSVKDVILTKTSVSKSNSYKSSMGYKADYANELLVVSDEWEVDPDVLKFSTPLGQGAFGKVVTGYCEDRKVAIKILKDSAPLSYKEDLLAEINLMKKLGTHPNIVSLVGACTLHEPIALIMEYVPYGNLQSFLKKCRQEGELQRRGGQRELTYSMVDAHGSIESGVITPTDILTFARQIVLAMEYLAEKKYVHRDLAARNVLLDYNKVVKVCDFGLSRDIYQDNQYKKLTSGKLPIKWMAVESLRDRVFTTQSDVWSFGILLWETVTMGASPYPNIALSDLFYMLSNGYRMEKPSNCSDELYSIMRYSWKENPKERPTFSQLRCYIEDLLTRDCDYLELDNIDVPLNNTDSSSQPISDPFSTSAMAAEAEAREQGRLISVSSGEEVTVDVHDRSTDKLLSKENDDASDYRSTKQKRSDQR